MVVGRWCGSEGSGGDSGGGGGGDSDGEMMVIFG
jgi:hypothetical protein